MTHLDTVTISEGRKATAPGKPALNCCLGLYLTFIFRSPSWVISQRQFLTAHSFLKGANLNCLTSCFNRKEIACLTFSITALGVSCLVLKVARLRDSPISYKMVLTINEIIIDFGSDGLPGRKIRLSNESGSEESFRIRGWKCFQTSSNLLHAKKQCSNVSGR